MPTLDTLIDDIYGLFGDRPADLSKLSQEGFGVSLSDLLHKRLVPRDEGHKNYLRMSNVGRPDRQLWYDINWDGPVQPIVGATNIKFMYGDLIEAMILQLAKAAGHTVEREQEEVEIDGIKGHIDAVIDGVVVDVKSASSYSFEKFRSGGLLEPGNDPFGYVGQLAAYAKATGSDGGAFLAVDKTLGKLTLLRVPQEVLEQYQVENRIKHIKEVVAHDEPPVRCYPPVPDGKSGNFSLSVGCSYCNHKAHCWADANNGRGLRTFLYSNGPKFLTHVELEPRVPEGDPF